ncbi:hypothetical protein KSP40_PGU000667 [Platanthera guangdongensis]|uniref:Uncharacterized protein n=1 Tax=Platanthera guangdongensis TaxID=2320717 RepID=A0ABR2LMU6_9ASPA
MGMRSGITLLIKGGQGIESGWPRRPQQHVKHCGVTPQNHAVKGGLVTLLIHPGPRSTLGVLGKVGFNFPILLTFIHYNLSWLLMAIMNAFSFLPTSPPAKSSQFLSLLTLGIVISFSTGLANVSLKYNSCRGDSYRPRFSLTWGVRCSGVDNSDCREQNSLVQSLAQGKLDDFSVGEHQYQDSIRTAAQMGMSSGITLLVKGGKRLEDLRASVFSELRTSEGAKRLQQRICGPTVFGKVGFNFPILLTFIHYSLSWLLMAIMNAFSFLPTSPPAKSSQFLSFLTLGIVMSFSTGLANVSLKYNSCRGDSYRPGFSLIWGVRCSGVWIIPSAVNKILWSNLQHKENWTALAYALQVAIFSFLDCLIHEIEKMGN